MLRAHSLTRFGVAFLALAFIAGLAAAPARAQGAPVSTTATLIDGVDGLAVDRSTPITASVWAIESVDDLMLVGGAFTHVRDRSNFDRIPRPYLAAFDPSTGEYVPWWGTQPDGVVYDILDLGDGRAAIIGEFESVNGVAGTDGLAIIDVSTGLVDTTYSLSIGPEDEAVVRAGAVHGNWLYLAGAFTSANDGGGSFATSGLARMSLTTGSLDRGWVPTLQGGGGWGIGVASTGRVFVGGYFATVNNVEDTETLAALSPVDGSVVAGWNHGFPHDFCNLSWRVTCGAVNGLAVVDDTVFVAGAKHFWSALSVADGTILVNNEITNDGQTVDVVDGMVIIGCHCSTATTSDEWNGIEDRYIRIIDPVALTEVASPTVNSEGSAGGWAAGGAPDGCLWVGGALSSTTVNGSSHPAWNLLRFCSPDGPGTNPVLAAAPATDDRAPTVPGRPVIAGQSGSSIDLGWQPATDDSGQVAYLVYRNGELVGRTSSTTYQDPLLTPNTTVEWRVAAVDMAGNTGELSNRSTPVRIGPRHNIAPGGVVAMSPAYEATTGAEKAVDGSTNGVLGAGRIARTTTVPGDDAPWWGIDLGAARDIDYVEVHPRTDAAWAETNNRLRIAYDTTEITGQSRVELVSAGHPAWVGPMVGDNPRVERADLVTTAQYLRLTSNAAQISLAEVRVMTVDPQPTPGAPPLDTVDPTSPTWKVSRDRGANTVLGWGGATDDVAVAYYRIYEDDQLIATTADRTHAVGPAGQAASGFTIIAFDAAGNASATEPGGDRGASDVTDCSVTRDGTSIVVTWTASENPERFIVRRSVNGSAFFWRNSPAGVTRSWNDTDRPGVMTYIVESRNGAVSGESVTCSDGGDNAGGGNPGGGLAAPAACSWTTDGTAIAVSWDAVANADSVIIERSVDGGIWWWRGRVNLPAATFADTERAGSIDYRVKAKDGSGFSSTTDCAQN